MKERMEAFEAKFSDIEKINPLFSKCKVKVLYTGENRNNSSFTKDSVEKAIPTLFNIPIVGEFKEKLDDFGGHGGKIEISEDEIKYVHTTKPYGLVPESATFSWEIHEDNGTSHEYLIVDGCYLWTGRYEEAEDIIKNGKGQSMEIEINSGRFNDSNVYEIDDFTFSALCILGDDTEPCFEGANITSYNLNKDDFVSTFNQMVAELKFSLNQSSESDDGKSNSEGGQKVDKKEFELSAQQLTKELDIQLRASFEEDEYGWKSYDYYYVDHSDTHVFAQSRKDEFRIVGFAYASEGDKPVVDFESKQIYKIEFTPMAEGENMEFNLRHVEVVESELNAKEKSLEKEFTAQKEEEINKLKGEFEVEAQDLKEEFAYLENEAVELRKFKFTTEAEIRQEAEEELFERFSKVLEEDEINSLKEKSSEFSLEDLETKLFVLVGKKKANFSATPKKKKETTKVGLDIANDVDEKPYGGLFDQYKK